MDSEPTVSAPQLKCPFCRWTWESTHHPQEYESCPNCRGSYSFNTPQMILPDSDHREAPAPTLGAEEFERAYAERGGMTVEELRVLGRVVWPCYCGEAMCEGWQSISQEYARDLYARLAERAEGSEARTRWACLACSERAGVVNDPTRHVWHWNPADCPLLASAPQRAGLAERAEGPPEEMVLKVCHFDIPKCNIEGWHPVDECAAHQTEAERAGTEGEMIRVQRCPSCGTDITWRGTDAEGRDRHFCRGGHEWTGQALVRTEGDAGEGG